MVSGIPGQSYGFECLKRFYELSFKCGTGLMKRMNEVKLGRAWVTGSSASVIEAIESHLMAFRFTTTAIHFLSLPLR
jgi:hypothetical protein